MPTPCHRFLHRGSTLVEAVIAIGVLAVAIPMVCGALAESGKSGFASRAETHSTWIVPVCLEEIRASRDGRSQYFTSTATGQTFPRADDTWALAFSADGRIIGRLPGSLYESGVGTLHGVPVHLIASMRGVKETGISGAAPMVRVDISVEYPAIQSASQRHQLDFHTRIP